MRESGKVLAIFMCALQTSKIEWLSGVGAEVREIVSWEDGSKPCIVDLQGFLKPRPVTQNPYIAKGPLAHCGSLLMNPSAPPPTTSFLFSPYFCFSFTQGPHLATTHASQPIQKLGGHVVMLCRTLPVLYTSERSH